MLLLYSIHLKSNMGGILLAIPKRVESATQIITHVTSMEKLYGKHGAVVVIIAGDFNSDPTDPQFSDDKTFNVFTQAGFQWSWQNVPREKRVTHPGNGHYPDATFDGFMIKGGRVLESYVVNSTSASDHKPVILKFSIP